ncbi:MAG: hypothetical protein V3S51_01780, partial [Dehalococcoidia bacterium]
VAFLQKMFRGFCNLLPVSAKESSTRSKLDVRVASPRRLFRSLHDFLEEDGYAHEYEPLKTERDAIGDTAIFNSQLVGRQDTQGRDVLSLLLGILLIFTILLIPLAIRLLRESRYTLTTIVEISVEGEAYRYRHGTNGATSSEVLDVVSDARVTLQVKTGLAGEESGISRPSRVRGERQRIAQEQQDLRDNFDQILISLDFSS